LCVAGLARVTHDSSSSAAIFIWRAKGETPGRGRAEALGARACVRPRRRGRDGASCVRCRARPSAPAARGAGVRLAAVRRYAPDYHSRGRL
jgi:hypothetical protein